MPTTSNKAAAAVAEPPFDLPRMQRLNEHPSLAPLYSRQVGLHLQLTTCADEVQGLRRQLGAIANDASFATATKRRAVEDALHERERAGGVLEEELKALASEIARVEEPIRQQVADWRTRASIVALAQYVDALEALAVASEAYQACYQTNYGLLQSWVLPQGWLDPSLPSRVAMARTRLEQLRQTLARLQD
jgi:hypothetical protein